MSRDGLYDDPKLVEYRQASKPLPAKYWLWPLYGAELENLGKDDRPIEVYTPTCGPDQLLVRHDAVGLCFSDIKVIKAGGSHPRLTGRDLKTNPVVLGHEVALTVMEVGENLKNKFKPGDRFIVQADIYYKGVGMAYGYVLQGGLSQYNVIGKELLEGDEGCYLLPVKPETGYAQAALTEPWACVVASYDVLYRAGWKPEGTVLIAAGPAAEGDYHMGTPYAGGQPPARVITMGVSGTLLDELRQRSKTDGFALFELGAPSPETLAEAQRLPGVQGFDDIVFLGADPALYELLEPMGNKSCVLNLVGAQALGKTQVDVGRLHYDNISITGTASHDLSLAYEPIRTELRPGGAAAFIGAAGPMGQMHIQRALQARETSRVLVATDIVPERLAVVAQKYSTLIEAKRGQTELLLRTPDGQSPAEFNARLIAETGGTGFDDVVVLVPSPGVIAGAVDLLAPHGVLNIFAGVSRGVRAPIDLRLVIDKGIRFAGTSGSAIRDLQNTLNAAESAALDPNLAVAAVSGFCGAKRGLEGMMHQEFPGKVVIYPQILDFPLTLLSDLDKVLPNVYAKLGPYNSWTNEAEAEFLKELLP